MSTPRFSVVIPTRERADTLRHALRTCLDQDFDDYEIIVCDNHSSPATRQVVEECASSKIRYVRAAEPLAMSANWELAVSHAAGEYVLVIGDDDGLMPYALAELDRLIPKLGVRAVRWTGIYYSGPTIALTEDANYLRVPMTREIRMVEAVPGIAEAAAFRACYSTLPMLYNAAVHCSLIEELRRRAGRVFGNHYPDVYTGFALGYLSGTFASLDVPMTVAGTSGRSYGVANLFFRGKSPLDEEFRRLNEKDRLPAHPWVPDLPMFPVVPVADSFLIAKENLFPDDDRLRLDRKALAGHYVHGVRAEDEASWRQALRLVRDTFTDDTELQAWFDQTYGSHPMTTTDRIRLRNPTLGFDGSFLHLDAAALGVTNVHEAARLCEKLLNYRGKEIPYGLQSPQRSAATAEEARNALEQARHALEAARPRNEELQQQLGQKPAGLAKRLAARAYQFVRPVPRGESRKAS